MRRWLILRMFFRLCNRELARSESLPVAPAE
jgi:hypothetical protein